MNTIANNYTPNEKASDWLRRENDAYRGTAGVSPNNRKARFVPGFRDAASGAIYRSCYADGRPAPMHLLEGLPAHLAGRPATGQTQATHNRLVSGFIRDGVFYTRAEAAAAVQTAAST